MTGEAGDSNIGEAGESITGEAGDSTIVKGGASMIRRDVGSIRDDVGESISGESGGARSGESSPADFFQKGSCFSFVSQTLGFFFMGSSSSPGSIWPLGRNNVFLKKLKITIGGHWIRMSTRYYTAIVKHLFNSPVHILHFRSKR